MTDVNTSATATDYTMYFDQSAHLDWDWIRTFAQNYWYYDNGHGVNDIIASGIAKAQASRSYYYTVCEMGFFRRFIEVNPTQIAAIKALGNRFQLISGGVTSPDCLVCSGEGFIRNYLVGQAWLKTLGMTAKLDCWLPDDFGQGPELPVLLAALGFESMAFSRLPGTWNSCLCPDLQNELVASGLDFVWQASDGSSVVAHWLINGYGFGNKLYQEGQRNPQAINQFVAAYHSTDQTPPPYSAAPTFYMYIPIDTDFGMPIEGLESAINGWTNDSIPAGATKSDVGVLQSTFHDFATRLIGRRDKLKTRAYNGTPYWTGYYASRPELKMLHYETVRALTAAEVIGLLTQPHNRGINSMLPTDFWSRIDQAWIDFAPSTHHDYICGTAPDPVYAGDQLPLLRGAAATARSLRGIALIALAGMACGQSPRQGVIVVNPLGFGRAGVASIDAIDPFGTSVTWADGSSSPTQVTAEGGMLVYATAPSFGYVTGTANASNAAPVDTASLTPTSNGATSYIIANEYLSATISADADWGIASLIDLKNDDAEVPEVLSGTGNAIAFYDDTGGGLYQFVNEQFGQEMPQITDVKVKTSGAWLGAMVMEAGPLRVWLRTAVSIEVNLNGVATTTRFIRDYVLCAGEPFLRMATTGAAPSNTSVMATFPLANKVTAITHGTGYHWTKVQPMSGFWGPPTFQPTHDFLLPQNAAGVTLAAVYHAGMPAWAFDTNGALIGCLLRNTPGDDSKGATGSDPAPHTEHYALRVPSGLGAPETGQPLQEALGFHTPLLAARMPDGEQYSGMLTASKASLAALHPGSPAVLTVAKPGSYDPTSLVLRVYQPTNTTQTLDVALPTNPRAARLVTATETGWAGGGSAAPTLSGITVTMEGAVATVEIPGFGRSN